MARTYPELRDELVDWLDRQHVFFVATAPSGGDGHVNVSPKGYDTFRVLDPTTVAYLDLTGSGVETIAHLRDNGRITLMFCAFEGPPRIMRLQGRGRVVEPGDEGWHELAGCFPELPGTRAAIEIVLDRISTSCGYGVPLMAYEGDRARMREWALGKGSDGLDSYRAEHNTRSIDGLPGLDVG